MNLNKIFNPKLIFLIILPVIFLAAAVYFNITASRLSAEIKNNKANYEKIDKESLENKNNYTKLKEDNAKAVLDLQRSIQERENLQAQIRGLLTDRNLARELEGTVVKLKKNTDALEQEKRELLDRNLLFKEKIKDLEKIQKQLVKEREQLKSDLEKEKDKSGIRKLEQQKAALEKDNSEITATLNKLRTEANRAGETNSRLKEDLRTANEKLDKFSKDYSEAVRKNKLLEQKSTLLPAKFAEIARQNKVLLKQTANMHYNLGVFYTKEKEYSRAAAEFEKSLELIPEDAYSHFNLGYIYAEYLVDRARAIEHFRQYLRLAKKEDKDVDWVKNYILTWQTLDGKKPME